MQIIAEGDLDDDGMLSYPEFEHAILKSPDFFGYVMGYRKLVEDTSLPRWPLINLF